MLENYNNSLKQNNGFHINGRGPIDDRFVLKDVESLFITEENKSNCILYNRAYDGLMVSVFESDETISIYQLKDATPYTPGHIVTVDTNNFKDFWTVINNKVINDMITDATYFSGSEDKDLAMLTAHGNLKKGMTVAQLEQMTISQLLMKVLFETAVPVKTVNQSGSISFKSPYNTTVEVGTVIPNASSFNYSYTPEKWNWTSKADSTIKGTEVSLSKFDSIKYYLNTSNSKTGGTLVPQSTTAKVVEGDNGYYYGVITYTENADAIDSLGKKENEDGEMYQAAKSGTLTTETINYKGAWKVYTNATSYSTSASTIWDKRNDNISASDFKGEDTKTDTGVLADGSKTVYLLFPKQTTDAQHFYIYVPATYKVTAIAAANNVVANTFDATKTVGTPTTVSHTNANGVSGSFKRYTIEKSAGNTAVKVTIAKA